MNSGQIDLDDERLDEAVRRAVLRVHREDDEVADAVDAVLLRLEGDERVEEVRDAEAVGRPALEVVRRSPRGTRRRAGTTA